MNRTCVTVGEIVFALCLLLVDAGCRPPVKGNYTYDMQYPIERVELRDFKREEATQKDEVSCWAACAAIVRSYYLDHHRDLKRPPLDQQQIIDKINGRPTDKPRAAGQTEVVAALDVERYREVKLIEQQANQKMTENLFTLLLDKNKRKQAEAAKKQREASGSATQPTLPPQPSLVFDPAFLVASLRVRREPLVAGLQSENSNRGHVVVIFGAEFQTVPHITKTSTQMEYETRLMCVKFFDPWQDDQKAKENGKLFGGEHTLAASQFAERCKFMASPKSAQDFLDFLDAQNRNTLKEQNEMFETPPAAATPQR